MNVTQRAYCLAFLTAFIWGTTFVAIKQLQHYYSPTELILYRFTIAYILLWIIRPKIMHVSSIKDNIIFVLAGLTGVCLYFICESLSVSMTEASIVGILVSIGPIFTALITSLILKEKKLTPLFKWGLAIALLGIILVSMKNASFANAHWAGNISAVIAALMWAIYSIISSRISLQYDDIILYTRRSIFFGILFLLGYNSTFSELNFFIPDFTGTFCLLYLGIGASALCFLMWNYALNILGPRKTSIFIYLVPVISIIASSLVLQEEITILMIIGTVCTLTGLVLCEKN